MDTLSAINNTRMMSNQPVNSYAVSQTLNNAQNATQSEQDVRGINNNANISEDDKLNNKDQNANIIFEDVKDKEDPTELAKQLQETIDKYSKKLSNLRFTANDDPECSVISVIDSKTDETIKQIPSEEALELMKRINSLCEDMNNNSSKDTKSVLLDTVV